MRPIPNTCMVCVLCMQYSAECQAELLALPDSNNVRRYQLKAAVRGSEHIIQKFQRARSAKERELAQERAALDQIGESMI